MNYIVVLNWNSAEETIACIQSLVHLSNFDQTRLIVCDNDSKPESYEKINSFLSSTLRYSYVQLTEQQSESYEGVHQIYLIKNKENYGYAGGNNRGIKFALKFSDMANVWVLNNDTIVQSDSLENMIKKISSDSKYGIVGSRLVELENKKNVQGIGGIINPWFCTTKEIGNEFKIHDYIDESLFEKKIDYVIGASLLISRQCLEEVGLLCEDYFLYYEEIDYCNRVKAQGFKVGIASESIVFHEQGASTGKGKSDIADLCAVVNRIKLAEKFYRKKRFFVRGSFLLVIINRLARAQYKRAISYIPYIVK